MLGDNLYSEKLDVYIQANKPANGQWIISVSDDGKKLIYTPYGSETDKIVEIPLVEDPAVKLPSPGWVNWVHDDMDIWQAHDTWNRWCFLSEAQAQLDEYFLQAQAVIDAARQ